MRMAAGRGCLNRRNGRKACEATGATAKMCRIAIDRHRLSIYFLQNIALKRDLGCRRPPGSGRHGDPLQLARKCAAGRCIRRFTI